jgi:hypothetical protein
MMSKCALPGCEKGAYVTGVMCPDYCSMAHRFYHERDQQIAAWLRSDDADDRRAAHNHHESPDPKYWADAIDAGEHHE